MGKAIDTCRDNLGYFNPPNVYRPAIIDIRIVGEYSAEDGATNTYRITQNDGKIFEFDVKNGSGGSAGRSVTSVEQIQISTESLGKNIARINLSDGTYTDVEIRNGAQGERGPVGERGPAGIDQVEASIGTNDPTQSPSVDKELTEGVLSLTFNNIKGQKGDKGDQGNTGSSVDYPYELVNNVTTDDATKGLSAAQGVVLDGKISQLGQYVENEEFVRLYISPTNQILFGIRKNGDVFFAAGVPRQIQEFVLAHKEDVLELLDGKVDKIPGKGLSSNDYTNAEKEIVDLSELVSNAEFIELKTDAENKIIQGVRKNGTKIINVPLFLDRLNGNFVGADIVNVLKELRLSDEVIEALKNDLDNLPDYWKTYLATKEADIQDAISNAGNHGDLFIFFSDYHLVLNTCKTPFIVKTLCDRLGGIKVFNNGDVLNTHATQIEAIDTLETFVKSFAGIDMYNVFGNHDSDPYGSQLSIDQYYPLLFKNLESNPNVSTTTKGYYYLDNKVQKIRYVILNTHETGIDASSAEGIAQLDWFVNVLNNVEDGWHVVVLAHMIYDVHNNEVELTSSGQLIKTIVDAYQNKQSGRYSTYSFDFTNAHGKVACMLIGHIHYDYSEYSAAGYPIITILQDAMNYPGLMPDNPEREEGTYTEQAFDIISINTTAKVIKTIRIGCGSNREFNFI